MIFRPLSPVISTVILPLAAIAPPVGADDTAQGYREAAASIPESLVSTLDIQQAMDELLLHQPTCDLWNLEAMRSTSERLRRLTRARRCEWDVDLSAGIEADFSHLLDLRRIATVIELNARICLNRGDREGFDDHVESLMRLTTHAGPDSLIASLVAMALLEQADGIIGQARDRGALDRELAARIAPSLDLLDTDDPFRLGDGLAFERSLAEDMLERFLRERGGGVVEMTPEDREEYHQGLTDRGLDPTTDDWPLRDQEELEGDLARYWQDLDRIWTNRRSIDLAAEAAALDEAVDRGDYGGFAKNICSTLSLVLERNQEATDLLAARRAELTNLLEGQRPPSPPRNAAFIYHQAIEHAAGDPVGWTADPSAARDIRRLLQMATAIETCRFPAPEAVAEALTDTMGLAWNPPVLPWWLPFLDAFIEDALRATAESTDVGDRPEAFMNLGIAMGIIAHLRDDPNLASAVVAATRCNQVLDRIDALASAGLDSLETTLLQNALRALPPADPFGVRAARNQTRRRIAFHLEALAAAGTLGPYAVPSTVTDLLYTTAWLYTLPPADLPSPAGVGECVWPDGEASTRCPPFEASAIEAARAAGRDALRAWSVGVEIPLTPSPLSSVDLPTLLDDVRNRLRDRQRSLRSR